MITTTCLMWRRASASDGAREDVDDPWQATSASASAPPIVTTRRGTGFGTAVILVDGRTPGAPARLGASGLAGVSGFGRVWPRKVTKRSFLGHAAWGRRGNEDR